jgi:hypothetical protein
VGEGGMEDAFTAAQKICLVKPEFRLHYHQKQHGKNIFIANSQKKKSMLR